MGAASRRSRDIRNSGSDVSHHFVGLVTSGLVKGAGKQRRKYVNTTASPLGQSLIKNHFPRSSSPQRELEGPVNSNGASAPLRGAWARQFFAGLLDPGRMYIPKRFSQGSLGNMAGRHLGRPGHM